MGANPPRNYHLAGLSARYLEAWRPHPSCSSAKSSSAIHDPPPDDFSTLFQLQPVESYRTMPCGRLLRVNLAMLPIFGFVTADDMLATLKSR